MQSEKFIYRLVILEKHLDTFGHVNNAVYLEILEEARWDLITQHGYGLPQVMQMKKGPVILDIQISFLKELKLRESIIVQTECLSYKGKIAKIQQIIFNSRGEEASKALMTFALFDLKERKIIDPTPEWLKAVGVQLPTS